MLDELIAKDFETKFLSHAAAILEGDFPEALSELEQALCGLTIPITEIVALGGGETKGTQRMRRSLNNRGRKKFEFVIRKIINGIERESTSHEIDHVKEFGGNNLALEIEWTNKDHPRVPPGTTVLREGFSPERSSEPTTPRPPRPSHMNPNSPSSLPPR